MRRNLVKESFEVVEGYACFMKIESIAQKQPWYHFARLVRNVVTHDLHFRFGRFDRTILPVNWRGKNIEASMDGQEMTEDFLDPLTTIDLIIEFTDFVQSN